MMYGPNRVNDYDVVSAVKDQTSETGQMVVVCDRASLQFDPNKDRYVVWTTAEISGKTEAWNGFYTDSLYVALTKMARRATGYEGA
jgi:hypothetical protein